MSTKNTPTKTVAIVDENDAITDQQVYTLLGLKCRTGHSARRLAGLGKIRAYRLGVRTLRYSKASVLAYRDASAT